MAVTAVNPSGQIRPFVGTPAGPVPSVVPNGSCAPAITASVGSQTPAVPPAEYSEPEMVIQPLASIS